MLKRAFDILVALVGLIVLSPVLLILVIAVRLTSPGPVFYRATRVGRGGGEFRLLKFRSMVIDADRIGPAVTGAADPRITPVGRLLRRTKIDELPQLWNVLIGDMSLVGPRPESPKYVALYTQKQRDVLKVRPGITSPASIAYRNESALLTEADWETQYIEEIMPAKLKVDLEYAQHPSLPRDIVILFQTALALLR
ncbi:MAG: sugar transferase [Chloroflexota bacterium]|nr:sugar transferase [Chloroflexota bacterium]